MTGYQSKKAAALDEDGMYLVHHTKRKDDDDDTQGYIAQYESALQKEYKRGYDAGKAAALKLALHDLENAEIATNSTYESTALIRKALAQPEQRPWVDLTDENITQVIDLMPNGINGWMSDWDLYEFARAVLAKSKERNA